MFYLISLWLLLLLLQITLALRFSDGDLYFLSIIAIAFRLSPMGGRRRLVLGILT